MNSRLRRSFLIAGRILISLLLLGYLLTRTEQEQLAGLWPRISVPLFLLAIGVQMAGIFVSTLKWWLLLHIAGERIPYWWLVRLYLIGSFFNNFLPTMIGGDAVRAFHLSRRVTKPITAISSVFVERLTGFLALVAIAWAMFVLLVIASSLEQRILWLAFWCIALATVALVLAFAAPLVIRTLSWLGLPDVFRWRATLERARHSLAAYLEAPGPLSRVIGLGFVYQLVWITTNAIAAAALGLDLPFSLVALIVPVSDIIGLVPIFFNNLGAREGTFVLALANSGVTTMQAVGLSLLVYGVRLLVSLVGGILYLLGGARMTPAFATAAALVPEEQDR